MFNWFELVCLGGVGLIIAGKRDVPHAAYWMGTQVGRFVGLLQGARARVDQYTETQNELRNLQHELRMGLRELNAVKTELTTTLIPNRHRTSSSSSTMMEIGGGIRGGIGGGVGTAGRRGVVGPPTTAPTTPTTLSTLDAIKASGIAPPPQPPPPSSLSSSSLLSSTPHHRSSEITTTTTTTTPTTTAVMTNSHSTTAVSSSSSSPSSSSSSSPHSIDFLASPSHTLGAVAEEEWARQGMDFKSRAELGYGLQPQRKQQGQQQQQPPLYDHDMTGSVLLSQLLQQSLVFDQYDRVTYEQDEIMRSKIQSIQAKVAAASEAATTTTTTTTATTTTTTRTNNKKEDKEDNGSHSHDGGDGPA